MAEYNSIETPIIAESPKIIPDEVRYIYVPKASLENAGIILPDKQHFFFDEDGKFNAKPLADALGADIDNVETKVHQIEEQLNSIYLIDVVDELPAVGEPNMIYLVPTKDGSGNNMFDEYLWVDGAWEWITTKQPDLTPYATVEFVNAKTDIDETALEAMFKEVLI
jgi:hypothetical protein